MIYWNIEIPIIVKNLIGDSINYTDERINELAIVAANYVVFDVNLNKKYIVDILNSSINPDPSDPNSRDVDFISFWGLKTACLIDQGSLRARALSSGIRTSLGSALLDIDHNVEGYKILIQNGLCNSYKELVFEYNIGNSKMLQAVLSPFVGNNFDPQMLNNSRSNPYKFIR
jgi:hypothetical protein